MSADVFEHIRESAARVARQARSVRIDAMRMGSLGPDIARAAADGPGDDPARRHFGDDRITLAYVLTLDAVNFGSGWFPVLRKRPGMSGYYTIATALAEQFETAGAWNADQLARITAQDCARVFGQDLATSDVEQLMSLFARALSDLGRFLLDAYDGEFSGPVNAACGRAARLVEILATMPLYRDVAHYGTLEVPFYKRAQITAADLAGAFGGHGPGRFDDLESLTLFADNLVPHVLRCEGVLQYSSELTDRIEAGELIPAGSDEEIEIRACALHAVEGLVASARAAGLPCSARQLDSLLWHRGQRAEIKARPRHRTRTPYY